MTLPVLVGVTVNVYIIYLYTYSIIYIYTLSIYLYYITYILYFSIYICTYALDDILDYVYTRCQEMQVGDIFPRTLSGDSCKNTDRSWSGP